MRWAAVLLAVMWVGPGAASAQTPPNPKDMSGIPLPATDVPTGTISVRVLRGSFANDVPNQPVQFVVDGKTRTITTDADGRAQIAGLAVGAKVQITAVVKGERLDSQPLTIAAEGIRMVLVATDAEAEAEAKRLAALPPEKGTVAFGPQSRVITQLGEDTLSVFYVLDIQNAARTRVDIGGPLIIDLPGEARGAGVLDGSSPQAKANGPHIRVLGPFAPGSTVVNIGYELPFSGGSVRLDQRWPAALPAVSVLIERIGSLDVQSSQIATRHDVASDSGQPMRLLEGPALGAGQVLTLDFTGLPHRPLWPRYVALSLALIFGCWGLWAAFQKPSAGAASAAQAQAKAERDRLLNALASLDRKRAAGKVTGASYATEREALVSSLERVYASLDTAAA